MRCRRCCRRCRGNGDQPEDEVITHSEHSPLKHFGIDKRYSELVRDKGNMQCGGHDAVDAKQGKSNTNNKTVNIVDESCGGGGGTSSENTSSSKSTSEVSEDPLMASESYLTTGASKSLFSTGSASTTQDVQMVGNQPTGLGESVDFDEEDENAADDDRVDGTERERRVRRLECYEWQNAASTQLDDEVLSSSAAAADNRRKAQQHKGSYSFSSEDAEKSSMEDRLLEKSSVSINYCEIGPRLHGLSSAYNSSTGERSVEVTTSSSYSGYTKIIESSEPLSVESVSSNWHKSSAAIEKREKITDEGSESDSSGCYFGSGARKNSLLLEFTSRSGSSFEDLSNDLVSIPAVPQKTLGQVTARSAHVETGRETSVDDGICYENQVSARSLNSNVAGKEGAVPSSSNVETCQENSDSSRPSAGGEGAVSFRRGVTEAVQNLPRISEVDVLEVATGDKQVLCAAVSGTGGSDSVVVSCSDIDQDSNDEIDEQSSEGTSNTTTLSATAVTTTSYGSSSIPLSSSETTESFSNITSLGYISDSSSNQPFTTASSKFFDSHSAIDEDEKSLVSCRSTTTTISTSNAASSMRSEHEYNSSTTDSRTADGMSPIGLSQGNVSFKIMHGAAATESSFEVFQNERLTIPMQLSVGHTKENQLSRSSKLDNPLMFENERILSISTEFQSSGAEKISSKLFIQSENDDVDSDSTLDEDAEDSISSSFFQPCYSDDVLADDEDRCRESSLDLKGDSELDHPELKGDVSRSTTDGNLSRFDNERKHSSMLSSPGSADVSILGDVQKQDKGDSELSVTSPANIERSFKGPPQSATFFAAITQSSSKHLLEAISHDSATAAGTNIHELADMSDNLSPLQESGHVMIETRHPAQAANLEPEVTNEDLCKNIKLAVPLQNECTAIREQNEDFIVDMKNVPEGKSAKHSFKEPDCEVVAPNASEIVEHDLYGEVANQNEDSSQTCDINVVRPRCSSLVTGGCNPLENADVDSSPAKVDPVNCALAFAETSETYFSAVTQPYIGVESAQILSDELFEEQLVGDKVANKSSVVKVDDVSNDENQSSESEEAETSQNFIIKPDKMYRSSMCSGKSAAETMNITEEEKGSWEEMLLQASNFSVDGNQVTNASSNTNTSNCSSGNSFSNIICSFNVSVAPFNKVGELCTLGVISETRDREIVVCRNREVNVLMKEVEESSERAESEVAFHAIDASSNKKVVPLKGSLPLSEETQKLETTVNAGISRSEEQQSLEVFEMFKAIGETHEIVANDRNDSFREELPLFLPLPEDNEDQDLSSGTGRGLDRSAAITVRISPVECPVSLSCEVMSFHLGQTYEDDGTTIDHSCEFFSCDVREFEISKQHSTSNELQEMNSCRKEVSDVFYVEASDFRDNSFESAACDMLDSVVLDGLPCNSRKTSELLANEVSVHANGGEFENVSQAEIELVNSLKAEMNTIEYDEFHPSKAKHFGKNLVHTCNIKPSVLKLTEAHTLESSLSDVIVISSSEISDAEMTRACEFAQTHQNSVLNLSSIGLEKMASELEWVQIQEDSNLKMIEPFIQFSTLTWVYDPDIDPGTETESLENFEPQQPVGSPRRRFRCAFPRNNFVRFSHTKSRVFSQVNEVEEIKCFRLRAPRRGTYGYFVPVMPDDFDELTIRMFGLFANPSVTDEVTTPSILSALEEPRIERTDGSIQTHISCMGSMYFFQSLCPTFYAHDHRTGVLEDISEEHSSDLSGSSEASVSVSLHPVVDESLSTFDGVESSVPSISFSGTLTSISDRLQGTVMTLDQGSLSSVETPVTDIIDVLDSEFTLTFSTQDLMQFDICPQTIEEAASLSKPNVNNQFSEALALSLDANTDPVEANESFHETKPVVFRRKNSSPFMESKNVSDLFENAAINPCRQLGTSPRSALKITLAAMELESSCEMKDESFVCNMYDYGCEKLGGIDVSPGCSNTDIDEIYLSCNGLEQVELSPQAESVVSSCNTSMESCCTVVLKSDNIDDTNFNQSQTSLDPHPQFCDDNVELGSSPLSADRTIDSIPTPVCGVSMVSSPCQNSSPKLCERSSSIVESRLKFSVVPNLLLSNKVENDVIPTECGQVTDAAFYSEELQVTDDSKFTRCDQFDTCNPDVAGDQTFSNFTNLVSGAKRELVEDKLSSNVFEGVNRQCSLYPVTMENNSCRDSEQSFMIDSPSRSKVIPTFIPKPEPSHTEVEGSEDYSSSVVKSNGVTSLVTENFLSKQFTPRSPHLENFSEFDMKVDLSLMPIEESHISRDFCLAKSRYTMNRTVSDKQYDSFDPDMEDLLIRRFSFNTGKDFATQEIEGGATHLVEVDHEIGAPNDESIGFVDTPRFSAGGVDEQFDTLFVNDIGGCLFLDRSFDVSDMEVVTELDASLLKTTVLPSLGSFPTSQDSCSFVDALLDEHGVKENDVMFLSPMPSTTCFPSHDMSPWIPRTYTPGIYSSYGTGSEWTGTEYTSNTGSTYGTTTVPTTTKSSCLCVISETTTKRSNPVFYASEHFEYSSKSDYSKSNDQKYAEVPPQKVSNHSFDRPLQSDGGTPWPESYSSGNEICSSVSTEMDIEKHRTPLIQAPKVIDKNIAPSSTLVHTLSFSEKEDNASLSSKDKDKDNYSGKGKSWHGFKLFHDLFVTDDDKKEKKLSVEDQDKPPVSPKNGAEVDPNQRQTDHGVKMGVIYEKAKLLPKVVIQYPSKERTKTGSLTDSSTEPGNPGNYPGIPNLFEPGKFDSSDSKNPNENNNNFCSYYTAREHQLPPSPACRSFTVLDNHSGKAFGDSIGAYHQPIIVAAVLQPDQESSIFDTTGRTSTVDNNINLNAVGSPNDEDLYHSAADHLRPSSQSVSEGECGGRKSRRKIIIKKRIITEESFDLSTGNRSSTANFAANPREEANTGGMSKEGSTSQLVTANTNLDYEGETDPVFSPTVTSEESSSLKQPANQQSSYKRTVSIVRKETKDETSQVSNPDQRGIVFDLTGGNVDSENENLTVNSDDEEADAEFHSVETEMQVPPPAKYQTVPAAVDTIEAQALPDSVPEEEPFSSPIADDAMSAGNAEIISARSQQTHYTNSSYENNFIADVPDSMASDFRAPETGESVATVDGDYDGNGDGGFDDDVCSCECPYCYCPDQERENLYGPPSPRYSGSSSSSCSDPNCSGRYSRGSTSSYCSDPECQGDVNQMHYPTNQHGSYSFSQSSTPEMASFYVEDDNTSDNLNSFRESVASGPSAGNSENFVVTVEDMDSPDRVKRHILSVVPEIMDQSRVSKTRRLHIHQTRRVTETNRISENHDDQFEVSPEANYWPREQHATRAVRSRKTKRFSVSDLPSEESTVTSVPTSKQNQPPEIQQHKSSRFSIFRWRK